MNLNLLFAFLVPISGFALALRTSKHVIAHELIEKESMTKIGTVYLASVFALLICLPASRFSLWLAVFVPLAIAAIALAAHVSRRSRIFQREALSILSLIILKMKSGRSFRHSIAEVASESDRDVRAKLTEIASVVAFSQQNQASQSDAFTRDVIEEFKLIDQQPHASLRRLSVLREKIRIEDDFRRRSGQVLSRLRAQSLVMCVLYLAVFIFMVSKFGWRENASALSLSVGFFMCGVVWMWLGGRRLKWKV